MSTDGLTAAFSALPVIFAFLLLTPPLVGTFYGWMRGYTPILLMVLFEGIAIVLQTMATAVVIWNFGSVAAAGGSGIDKLAGIGALTALLVGLGWRLVVYRRSQLRWFDHFLLAAVLPALLLLTILGGIFHPR